jgi:hypothetical protein
VDAALSASAAAYTSTSRSEEPAGSPASRGGNLDAESVTSTTGANDNQPSVIDFNGNNSATVQIEATNADLGALFTHGGQSENDLLNHHRRHDGLRHEAR